jgi:hypothetical protein
MKTSLKLSCLGVSDNWNLEYVTRQEKPDKVKCDMYLFLFCLHQSGGGGSRATTYEISAYHNRCCEFESRSGRGVQHYVIKFVGDLRQVGGFLHQ